MTELGRQIGERAQAAAVPRCTVTSESGSRCQYAVQDERHEANDDDELRHEDTAGHVWITLRRGGQHLPKPAAEPQPEADLLDLVRQYGYEGYQGGVAAAHHDEEGDVHYYGKARRLYDRIEAEVRRLRAELLREQDAHVATIRERDAALVEVERLEDVLSRVRRERDLAERQLKLNEEMPQQDGPVFTKDRGEIHVTAVLDDHGQPRLVVQWPPRAGEPTDEYQGLLLRRIAELEAEVAAQSGTEQQDGPVVLTLPEVPEGATLVGGASGNRYTFHRPSTGWCSPERGPISLGLLLTVEGSARVEMAPSQPTLADDIATLHRELQTADAVSALRRLEAALEAAGS